MTGYNKVQQILLQNATAVLLQNATVLLQNATVITNCDDFISKCDSYYKMRRLLQIATLQFGYGVLLFTISQEHLWRAALLYLKVFGY